MSDPKRKDEPWLRSPRSGRQIQEQGRKDIGSGLPIFWLDLLTRRKPPSERYQFRSLVVLALIAAAVMIAAVAKDSRTSDLDQLQNQAAPMMAIPLGAEQPVGVNSGTPAGVNSSTTLTTGAPSNSSSTTSTTLPPSSILSVPIAVGLSMMVANASSTTFGGPTTVRRKETAATSSCGADG